MKHICRFVESITYNIFNRSLLLGTYKHGFGRYEEIRNDPSLCFMGRVKDGSISPPLPAAPLNGGEKISEAQPIKPEQPFPGSDIAKAETGENSVKTELADTNLLQTEPKREFEAALKQEFYGVKNDEEQEGKAPEGPSSQSPNKATQENGRAWPSSKILSHRVKRILRSLDMVKRQQEKDSKKVS